MADDRQQLEYLEAMGIVPWVRRGVADAPAAIADTALDEIPVSPVSPPPVARGTSPVAELDWTALATVVSGCRLCELHQSRTQTVFGVGSHTAEWLIIGEAPGAEEDRRGEPFVGRAGQLLTAMLAALGLKREEVYIANMLKCRPPGNRDPRPEEVLSCEPYLQRQISLLRPKIILVVGRIAAQSLLRVTTPIGKLRGQRYAYGADNIPLIVTYHPAYLLRSPGEKRKAWSDLLYAQKIYQELA